jgi:hypothetical protein
MYQRKHLFRNNIFGGFQRSQKKLYLCSIIIALLLNNDHVLAQTQDEFVSVCVKSMAADCNGSKEKQCRSEIIRAGCECLGKKLSLEHGKALRDIYEIFQSSANNTGQHEVLSPITQKIFTRSLNACGDYLEDTFGKSDN